MLTPHNSQLTTHNLPLRTRTGSVLRVLPGIILCNRFEQTSCDSTPHNTTALVFVVQQLSDVVACNTLSFAMLLSCCFFRRAALALWKATVDDEGLCRFGWATQRANFNLGTDAFGYGFGGTGMKSHRGQFEKYGEAFAQGDRVGCRLDLQKVSMNYCCVCVL